MYPKITDCIITPTYRCLNCWSETKEPYYLSNEPFCNYKCSFKYIFSMLYGIHTKETWDSCYGYGSFKIGKICLQEGYSNEQLKQLWTAFFPTIAIPSKRQEACFEITKKYMGLLK